MPVEVIDALASRRQCVICLKYFREMTEEQWRANAPYHFLSTRHRRAIQVRSSSSFPKDRAVLRYRLLKLLAAASVDGGRLTASQSELASALNESETSVAREVAILVHRQLVDSDSATGALRATAEALAVIDLVERGDQDLPV